MLTKNLLLYPNFKIRAELNKPSRKKQMQYYLTTINTKLKQTNAIGPQKLHVHIWIRLRAQISVHIIKTLTLSNIFDSHIKIVFGVLFLLFERHCITI